MCCNSRIHAWFNQVKFIIQLHQKAAVFVSIHLCRFDRNHAWQNYTISCGNIQKIQTRSNSWSDLIWQNKDTIIYDSVLSLFCQIKTSKDLILFVFSRNLFFLLTVASLSKNKLVVCLKLNDKIGKKYWGNISFLISQALNLLPHAANKWIRESF